VVFFGLLALAVPVAHAMVGGVAAALWFADRPMAVIAQRLYTPTQSFPMLAIPFFIPGGKPDDVRALRRLPGQHRPPARRRFKGGLGHVSIIGS
jgi:hypothetical protein